MNTNMSSVSFTGKYIITGSQKDLDKTHLAISSKMYTPGQDRYGSITIKESPKTMLVCTEKDVINLNEFNAKQEKVLRRIAKSKGLRTGIDKHWYPILPSSIEDPIRAKFKSKNLSKYVGNIETTHILQVEDVIKALNNGTFDEVQGIIQNRSIKLFVKHFASEAKRLIHNLKPWI